MMPTWSRILAISFGESDPLVELRKFSKASLASSGRGNSVLQQYQILSAKQNDKAYLRKLFSRSQNAGSDTIAW
jgi:hypothetical protein